jgi:hypothetical protein
LLFLLKQLFQENLAFQRNRYGADRVASAGAAIKISEEDLKSRVCFCFIIEHVYIYSWYLSRLVNIVY